MFLIYGIINEQKTYAVETSSENKNIKISKASQVNLEDIILKNTKTDVTEEIVTEEVDLEYITKYQNNDELTKGMIQVIQEGRNGIQQIKIKKVYEQGNLIKEENIGTTIKKASVNKIVEIGTANYTSNYKVKVGDTLYVTSDRLSVMLEKDDNSTKVTTLIKGDELKLLEIQGEWYKISSGSKQGWVKSECTTYINPNTSYEEEQSSTTEKTKQQLISKLDFQMKLNEPSGLSIEQFKKVLTDSKDVNKVFYNNAQYFYYIEKQYNINGVFVAAVGIHESAWGTSKISLNKKNLFGYGAYDSSAYNSAYNFSDYSESIDLLARVFVKYYLNPSGTKIYDGNLASGKYYNGPTLSGVNKKYATDKNWANAVYNHMSNLYNKL